MLIGDALQVIFAVCKLIGDQYFPDFFFTDVFAHNDTALLSATAASVYFKDTTHDARCQKNEKEVKI